MACTGAFPKGKTACAAALFGSYLGRALYIAGTGAQKEDHKPMFTGIITDIGTVTALEQKGDLRARIACGYDTDGIEIGASIASDGVCLTVVALGEGWSDVDISAETV